MLIWDSNGQSNARLAGTRFMHDVPSLVSKAAAMRDGIKAVLDGGLCHIYIEGGNQFIIQMI